MAAAEKSTRKARKTAKKARKRAGKKHRDFEKAAQATAKTVKRTVGAEQEPRRWPWLFVAFALGTAAFVLLRRTRRTTPGPPPPAGDGPVPSYREDPVPSSDSNSGKTVSTADDPTGDSAPARVRHGRTASAQLVDGDGPDDRRSDGPTRPPSPSPPGGGADEGPTAGPDDRQV